MDVRVIATTTRVAFSAPSPLVIEGRSHTVSLHYPPLVVMVSKSPIVKRQVYRTVTTLPANIFFDLNPARVEIFSQRVPRVDRRFQRSAWQARLGARLDPIKRRVQDNQILLTSHPTDMLRVRVKEDPRSHDVISKTIVSNEILPIILPTLIDVPMRRLINKNGTYSLSISMMEKQEREPMEAFCPLQGLLERGDLLFRIIKDPYIDKPYFMVLQVKEELGTIAYSSLLYIKYILSFYDEPLPPGVLELLAEAANKREKLTW